MTQTTMLTNESLAGEMLNPATGKISVEEPVPNPQPKASELRPIPEITVYDNSNREPGDTTSPVPELNLPDVDVEGIRTDLQTGERVALYAPNVGEVRARRSVSKYVQAGLRNPGDEGSALRAGYLMFLRLNPDASEVEYIDAMRSRVFGAGTDNPRNCANRLFEILGGNADALDFAEKIESGEIPLDEARQFALDDEQLQKYFDDLEKYSRTAPRNLGPNTDKTYKHYPDAPRTRSKLADAFRQSIFDSEAVRDWQALRSDGFSAGEILSVFDLTERVATGDKATMSDWFPHIVREHNIPAHRRSAVLEAVKTRLPEADSDWFSRFATRFEEMVDTSSGNFVNVGLAKDASKILSFGAVAFEEGRAFTEKELTDLNAWLGLAGKEYADAVRSELLKQGIVYEPGKYHKLNDKEKLALTREYRKIGEETADVAQARSVVLSNYAKKFEDGNAVGDWTADNLPSITENLMWIGASIATYGWATPAMMARYGADSYAGTANAALAGGATALDAVSAGKFAGVGSAALEAIPVSRLLGVASRGFTRFTQGLFGESTERVVKSLSEVSNSDLADLFLPKTLWKKSAREVKSFAGTFASEMGTELSQSALEGGATQWAIDGDWQSGAVNSLWDSSFGKDGFDLAASVFAISLGGQAMARGVKWLDHRKAVEAAVRRSGASPESRAEAEQIFIAEAKNAYARKATLEVMAAIDNASDGRAFGGDGKLTADMQAFVHRAMIPTVDENGNATEVYDRAWNTKKKDAFLRSINGGKSVSSKMREALDLLDAASEVAGEQVKEAVDKFKAATDKQLNEGVEQLQGKEAEQDAFANATLPGNGGVDVNPATLSREHLGELVGRFLESSPKMGDADISKELRAVFMGEDAEGADENVIAALNGIAKRCTSAFEFLSFLDAYAAGCDANLKTRTNAKTRAARVLYYGFQHVGTLARPDTNYERFMRLAYFAGTQNRRSLGTLTDEQRGKMQTMLGKIFAGTQVQLGGIPAWASAEAQAAIARGEINGAYASGKVWIADDAFVGTGLHEVVWHATWAWAKQSAPELYKQMQSYVRNAPRWLREQIAQDYAGKSGVSFDEISDEIGAFMFENEFEGDFLNGLNKESRSWWDGLQKTFGKAFKKLRGNEKTGDAHDAVRELMKGFLDGEMKGDLRGGPVESEITDSARRYYAEAEGGAHFDTSAHSGKSLLKPHRTPYNSENMQMTETVLPDNQRVDVVGLTPINWERYSAAAAAMNRTGDIPDGKSPREVAERIEANNKVSVTGMLSEEIRKAADAWCETAATSARRALAGKMLAVIPEGNREVDLPDGRVVEITSNGIANILQHMPNVKSKFRDGALDFVLKLPEFFANAEEFYREFKGIRHGSFGGVVDFNGTPFYVSVTCTGEDSLRVKAVNSIKKASLNAWTETTASGESESVLKAAFKLGKKATDGMTARLPKAISAHSSVKAPATSTADVLKWILSNQDKTAADFRLFLRGWDDAEETRRKDDERWSRRRGFSRGDAEAQRIEAEAKANGTWLKAPNGKPSNLNPRQWVQVRTEAFKKWFGDWERLAKFTFVSEKTRDADAKTKLMKIAGKDLVNTQTGIVAQINSTQRDKLLSGRAKDKSVKNGFSFDQHNFAVSKVASLYENAVLLGEFEDDDGDANVKSVFRFFSPFYLDGHHVVAVLTVKNTTGNKLYSVELDEIKKLDGSVGRLESKSKRIPASSFGGSIGEVRDYVNTFFNVSKVVDENGEPLVVYHGSKASFNAFSHEFTMRNGAMLGRGFYFTTDEEYASGFGGNVFSVFLNLKNPLHPAKNEITKEDLKRVIRFIDPHGDTVADYAISSKGYPGKSWYENALNEAVEAIFSTRKNYSQTSDSDIIGELFSVWGQEDALRGIIEVLGYDGFIPVGTFSDDFRIVFLPEQIKSATDNAGTFDASNPDIRWSLANHFAKIGENEWTIPESVTAAVPELRGKIVCDDDAYEHIWSEHKDELAKVGASSAQEFVERTIENVVEVYRRRNGGFDLVARLRGESGSADKVLIYLKKSEAGDFYDVGNGHPIRNNTYKKEAPVWRANAYPSNDLMALGGPNRNFVGNATVSGGDVNPERHSRAYRAADTHEQELARMAYAVALASKMIQSGKENVRLPAWLKELPEWERIGAINRAFNLFRVAKARGLIKNSMSADAANTAAIEANRAVTERFVHAVAADAMANGVSVERMARGRIQDETERMARSRVDVPSSVSDATKALGVALQRAQGAKASMGKSAKTLHERAMAFPRVILQAAQSRFMPRDSSRETVIDAIIAEAEDAALPTEKLRELRRQVSTKEFAGTGDAANVLRANAADLLTEVEAAISVQNEMLVAGMNMVKDRAVGSRIEAESAGAQRSEKAALAGFEGEDPSMIARRVATSVLVSAWRNTARALGLRGVDYNADVEDGATNPAAVLKFIVLSAERRADDLDAQADAITEKLHSKTLSSEESREANEERNKLREEALLFRDVVAPAGTFTEVFKEGAEEFVKDTLKRGGGFSVANALSALRGAVTLRDALGKAYKLFMTASTREAEANIPYLSGRLRGLISSLPKLDERTDDDASYYSARFRVLANQLREVGNAWWEKSFEEVQAEIDRLESLENRDDHTTAKLQALQMVGGAKHMSAEMLDMAFWTILAERDTAFLEQVSDLRERRADVEQRATFFVEALKANPHAKPADKSTTQSVKENATSQNGLSLGDRLRGWIKNAKGELWEKASAFVDDFERRFSDAASEYDRLVIAQHDWQIRTMREIFGKAWQAKIAELSTVVVPELAKFDRTSRSGVKTDDGLTAMHALHLYMSARQKSFQAPLLHPAMFSEESEGALLSRKAYIKQAKDGGELETFLKTHKGGVLWKLKTAWSVRWKEILPQLNEAYRKVYGFDMYDPFGETDYYPLRLKSEAKAHASGITAKSGAIMLPVGRRFQSRTINVAELDANRKFAEVVFEQMENTLHTIAYAEVHRDAERFMGNAAISDVRNARVAYSDVKGFKDHLADILALPSQQGEASRMGRFVAGTSTVLALAGNLFTPIRQMSGGGTYAAESPFGVGATTAAMTYAVWGTLWGGQYMKDLLRVVRDPLFRARYEEAARFVEQEALRGGAGTGVPGATKRLFKKLKNASLYGVRFGDAVPIMTCGVGFYRMFYAQNLRKGMSDAQAHEKAMNDMIALTEKTQQTRRVMNKTRLQRDTGLSGQILGQFKSMNDQAFGNESRVLSDLASDLKSAKRWKRALKSVVAYHLLFGAFSDFVMQSVFIALSGDDDDESTFWEKLNLWELGAATVGGGLYGSTIAFVAFDLMNIEDVGRRIANWAFDAEMPGRRPAAVAASLPSVSILLNTGTHTAKAVSMLGDEEVEGKDAFVEFCKSFGGAKSIMRLVDKITEDSEEE